MSGDIDIATGSVNAAAAPVATTITPAVVPPPGASPIDLGSATPIAPIPVEITNAVNDASDAVFGLAAADKANVVETETEDTENAVVLRRSGER